MFARRLFELMARKGMSQSDVARAIWGTVTDNQGKEGAANRDRIHAYVHGRQMPRGRTLKRLAEVLGVTVFDLVPGLAAAGGATVNRPPPTKAHEPLLSGVAGRPDLAHICIGRVVSMTTAVAILDLLAKDQAASAMETVAAAGQTSALDPDDDDDTDYAG